LEPPGHAMASLSDACLRRAGPFFGVVQEYLGQLSHRRQLGASQAAYPQAVIDWEAFRRVLYSGSKLAGTSKRSRCFIGMVTSRGDKRVPLDDLQAKPQQPCIRPIGQPIGKARSLVQMRDGLTERGSAERQIAGLSPPGDSLLRQSGLGAM